MESTNGKMELDHFSRTIFIYIVVQSRKEKIVTGVGWGWPPALSSRPHANGASRPAATTQQKSKAARRSQKLNEEKRWLAVAVAGDGKRKHLAAGIDTSS
jgi:hypothetical protein